MSLKWRVNKLILSILAQSGGMGYEGLEELEKMEIINLINEVNIKLKDDGVSRKGISDGYHTFDELYYHRMMLFSIICNQNKEIAWKSKQHHDGTMFGNDNFIVGIETPEGQYTYHYDLKYWDMYDVKVLAYAPKYDGHKPGDITRLLSILPNKIPT